LSTSAHSYVPALENHTESLVNACLISDHFLPSLSSPDELKWKEQVQYVRRKCFTGLVMIEECVTINNKKAVIQRPGTTPHGLLLGCMAGVLKRVEAEVRESAELWYEIDFVTTITDT